MTCFDLKEMRRTVPTRASSGATADWVHRRLASDFLLRCAVRSLGSAKTLGDRHRHNAFQGDLRTGYVFSTLDLLSPGAAQRRTAIMLVLRGYRRWAEGGL